MGKKKRVGRSTRRAARVTQADVGPHGQVVEWPRPVQVGDWVDPDGVFWRTRGQRLKPKAARKLIRDPEVAVAWAYELDVAVLTGAERAGLLTRVEAFLDGDAPAFSHFDLGDFRDQDRRRLLVIEESC